MKKKIEPVYEKIVYKIDFSDLPIEWQNFNFKKFSKKNLYDYQIEAVKNGLKMLYFFNQILQKELDFEKTKKILYKKVLEYRSGEVAKDFNILSKNVSDLFDLFREYYEIKSNINYEEVEFYNFINRMGFWMATGSGKTLVIIKLIEILNQLQLKGLIPKKDILILTYRKDLIEQIKEHIDEYNQYADLKIRIWDLRDYADVKNGNKIVFLNEINVFIYRSDLISEETKENILNFEDIDNEGAWYLFLDEAHKGKADESKRQMYYSIITRKGFLFNFSATFTHEWDILTTVFNFNLQKFTEKGYGKNILLIKKDLKGFLKKKSKINEDHKRIIILQTLILLTLIKSMRKYIENNYHDPLIVCLVNSVNTTDSDLELFFNEIEKTVQFEKKEIFNEAKEELVKEFENNHSYMLSDEILNMNLSKLRDLRKQDVLEEVFNTKTHGELEVIHSPYNKKELIFKVKTAEKPFALIKIGDKTNWIKNKLRGYEYSEEYDYKSYFQNINNSDSPINILLGSRSFYEGWDSNRPNVMIFINIGTGDSRKFVLQSIGRGVRIEPVVGIRKRLKFIENNTNNDVSLLETLFIFGTSIDNIKKILETIKFIKTIEGNILKLKRNPELEKIKEPIFIPIYNNIDEIEIEGLPIFKGNKTLLLQYLEWLKDDKLLLIDHPELKPDNIKKLKVFLEKGKIKQTKNLYIQFELKNLIDHLKKKAQYCQDFKELEHEIIHFKKINVILEKNELNELNKKISKVINSVDVEERKASYKLMRQKGEITLDEFVEKIEHLAKNTSEFEVFKKLKIKKILNHYYIPLLISQSAKLDYINHIIDVPSERHFIEALEDHLNKKNHKFKNFDWWVFSKIDEHLDKIYIPYKFDKKFKPDFIFWLKKNNNYYILFVDPKSTEFSDYEDKIDGYEKIFNINGKMKEFEKGKYVITVQLKLFTDDKSKIHGIKYSEYWEDNMENLLDNLR